MVASAVLEALIAVLGGPRAGGERPLAARPEAPSAVCVRGPGPARRTGGGFRRRQARPPYRVLPRPGMPYCILPRPGMRKGATADPRAQALVRAVRSAT
ncbi:hypothetical protein EBF04_16845 [Streptomyces sp. I6]|nr:hypothetical protein EBF04_16845 [Streptomyces sp. I6]